MKRWLALLLLLPLGACGYNRIQTLDEQAGAAQSQIEVQLQRRADLIGNLVNTVKGYAQHEETVFTQVAQARVRHDGRDSVERRRSRWRTPTRRCRGALGGLMVPVEAYPQLKADQGFLRLQDELTGTENRIAVSRNDYNQAVNAYNAYIRQFPTVITAKVTGAQAADVFHGDGERAAGSADGGFLEAARSGASHPARLRRRQRPASAEAVATRRSS